MFPNLDNESGFFEAVRELFGFLVMEHGFQATETGKGGMGVAYVIFSSPRFEIMVGRERGFIEVQLRPTSRLFGPAFPFGEWYYVDRVLELVGVEAPVQAWSASSGWKGQEEALVGYAAVIRANYDAIARLFDRSEWRRTRRRIRELEKLDALRTKRDALRERAEMESQRRSDALRGRRLP